MSERRQVRVWNGGMQVVISQGQNSSTKVVQDENGNRFEIDDDGSEPIDDKITKKLRELYPNAP